MKKAILVVMLGVVTHAQAGQAHREVTERAASLKLADSLESKKAEILDLRIQTKKKDKDKKKKKKDSRDLVNEISQHKKRN